MTSTFNKIAIVGAGAVGSLLGGLLSRAGHDVTLVGRGEHVAAINAHGLHIEGVGGEFTVSITASTSLNFKPDIVFITVKSPDLEDACHHVVPFIENTPVCTLQNGIRSDTVAADYFGKHHCIGGIVMFNARYLYPGQVTWGSKGTLLIGNAFQSNDASVTEIASMLDEVIPTTLCANIQGARYTKLLWNILGNSLDALTGSSMLVCMNHPGMRTIAAHLLKEALNVIEKSGVTLASLPNMPISEFRNIITLPLHDASRELQRITMSTCTLSSMLQSLKRGKPTEIDYLNGEIVNLGRSMQIATPFNAKVVQLIRTIESTHNFFSPADLDEVFSVI